MTALTEQRREMPERIGSGIGFRQLFLVLVGLIAAVVVALTLYPLIEALAATFIHHGRPTLAPFRGLLALRGLGTIVQNTVIFAVGTLVLAAGLGIFLAWANERTDARIESLAGLLPILPLVVPPIGSALGYIVLFSNRSGIGNMVLRRLFGMQSGDGPLYILNFYGMIVITALGLAPMAYLIVAAAFRNIDPALDEASRVFGASPLGTLRRVTLPVVAPAMASAALLIGVLTVSAFTVPYVIGTGARITTISVYIFRLFESFPADQDSAVALSVCMLVVIYIGLLLQMRVARSLKRSIIAGKRSAPSVARLGSWRWMVRGVMILYVVSVVLPLIGLAIGALQPYSGALPNQFTLRNFVEVLDNPETRSALENSFVLAALAGVIDMLIAALLIFVGTRMMRRGGRALELALMTPSMIPPVVLAVAFLVGFSGPPFNLYGTHALVLLAYCILFIPLACQAASSTISQVSTELSEASHIAGAGLLRTLWKVVLPQVAHGLLAGWIIVFFMAVNEVTASSFLGSITSSVVAQVAIDYFTNGRLSEVAALTLIVTVVTAVVVLMAHRGIAAAYRSAPRS